MRERTPAGSVGEGEACFPTSKESAGPDSGLDADSMSGIIPGNPRMSWDCEPS